MFNNIFSFRNLAIRNLALCNFILGIQLPKPVTVYVLRQDAEITPRDNAELIGYLVHRMPLHIGVTLPEFPCFKNCISHVCSNLHWLENYGILESNSSL